MTPNTFPLLVVLTLISAGIGGASTIIVDTTPALNFALNDPTPGDQITIVNGSIVSGFQTTEVNSSLNSSTFEFANKVSVTVNDTGGGGDTISVNISIPATGLTEMTVNGGSGADTFIVTPSASIPFTINGGGNPQPAPGNVLTVILSGTTGASLADVSTVSGLQGAWTFTSGPAVNFTGIQTLNSNQVPEPGALPLAAMGLAGFFIARIRLKWVNAHSNQ